ncbi:MAG: tyrosine-protein phosphatase [Muribaculaceae bacterium]|nr:tyrosine-protein phosphatase [Muribaculaceae bacterium]
MNVNLKKKVFYACMLACCGVVPASGVTLNVSVPEGTHCCFVSGSFNGWDVVNAVELTRVSDNLFSVDLPDVSESSIAGGYKYVCGPDWKYVEKSASGGEIGNRTKPSNPDVVGSWAQLYVPGQPSDPGQTADPDHCRGFRDNPEDKTVTFIFDNNLWKAGTVTKVEVRGSFNGWASKSDYALSYDKDNDIWTVTLPYSAVKVPGNSGQPEFKFVTNGSNYLSGDGRSFMPEGYVFMNGDRNNIVVFDRDDFETIKANSKIANVIKTVSDFDLTTREGKEEISNFRRVPGTSALFRSYHPYKYTKTSNPTEPLRIQYLTELAVEEGIKSDICLSENEERNLLSFTISGTKYTETIAPFYQEIISKGQVLYVGTENGSTPSYNEVYYNSAGTKFAAWVKEICRFIISDRSEPPYLIHCRIGTDRTGMFSATLAALCGAAWSEIEEDYENSTRMGIQEFRGGGLLRYGFEQMLGVEDVTAVPDLAEAVADNLVSRSVITPDELVALRARLGAADQPTSADVTMCAPVESVNYYSLTGFPVNPESMQAGVYVRTERLADGTSRTSKVMVR